MDEYHIILLEIEGIQGGNMKIKNLYFECTGSMCPEQYDVYNNDEEQVGYIHLRWGELKCYFPDVNGEIIYLASIGDGLTGRFENNEQRMEYLNIIADEINTYSTSF